MMLLMKKEFEFYLVKLFSGMDICFNGQAGITKGQFIGYLSEYGVVSVPQLAKLFSRKEDAQRAFNLFEKNEKLYSGTIVRYGATEIEQ